MSKSEMSMVDAFLMSSAVKENAKNHVYKVPSYAVEQSKKSGISSIVETQRSALIMGSQEFRIMSKEFKPNHSENLGYMMVLCDKEWYTPG